MKIVSITMPPELHEFLKAIAAETQETVSAMTVRVLHGYFEQFYKKDERLRASFDRMKFAKIWRPRKAQRMAELGREAFNARYGYDRLKKKKK